MEFVFKRSYTGTLKAVIFDLAGTTVDYGSLAPALVFVEVFKQWKAPITLAEARGPMGKHKKDHLRELFALDSVRQKWRQAHGRLPNDEDLEEMFNDFIPRQLDTLAAHSRLIPGVLETVERLRKMGLKIGATTGYTRQMTDIVLDEARKQGYEPDAAVCVSDVPAGRPAPWMCFVGAMNLGVYPMPAVVKIGDTVPDIEEGLNAGMWTIAVAETGNEMGLSEKDVRALSVQERRQRLQKIYAKLSRAGAHYVVDSVADVAPVLEKINQRLAAGEKP